jgi:uncharacterized protein YjbI with pentapeptide repeats
MHVMLFEFWKKKLFAAAAVPPFSQELILCQIIIKFRCFCWYVRRLGKYFGVLSVPRLFVDFQIADFGIVNFWIANFRIADFLIANFRIANFRIVDFQIANFWIVNFQLANFRIADFRIADYWIANFWIADSQNVKIRIGNIKM